jgi:hypothetical protein
MKKLWPLLLLVIPYQSIHAQEVQHPPAVEQCRADQKLWLAQVETPQGAGIANVTYTELDSRVDEMYLCETVDPSRKLQYYNTFAEIVIRQEMRGRGFLERHNLYNQFLAEDVPGGSK